MPEYVVGYNYVAASNVGSNLKSPGPDYRTICVEANSPEDARRIVLNQSTWRRIIEFVMPIVKEKIHE